MRSFIGNSGKFYVKNPFNDEKYSYAVYGEKSQWELHEKWEHRERLPMEYVTSEKAFSDFDKPEKDNFYQFKIDTPDGIQEYQVMMTGQIIGQEKNMKELLQELYEQYDRDNVTYEYEKV